MIKREDLVDVGDANYETRRNEFMRCMDCGEDIGGTQGDFFMMPMNEAFVCPECRSENIAIVRLVHKVVVVKQ